MSKLNIFVMWTNQDISHHKLTFIDRTSNQLIKEITNRLINSQLMQPFLVHVVLFGIGIVLSQEITKQDQGINQIDYFSWHGT